MKRWMAVGLGAAGMIVALLGSSVPAQVPPNGDSTADGILRRSCDRLRSSSFFRIRAEISYDEVLLSGKKLFFTGSLDAAVNRPDRLRTEYRGSGQHSGIWYDGKSLTLHDWRANLYAVTEAPSDLDAFLDHTVESLGFSVPVADLFYSDPYGILMENVKSVTQSGLEEVGGLSCHHLTLRQEDIDWEIWIEEESPFLPRKLRITYKNMAASPQYTVLFTDWDFSGPPENAEFTFEPPAGAERIEFLSSKEIAGSPEEKMR